jgi:polyisoprenoid-binding protein YceI
MKNKNLISMAFVLLMIFSLNLTAQRSYLLKSYQITIEGTSNVQSWTADVPNVEGEFILTADDSKISSIDKISLQFDASTIAGSEGRRMNDKIYEALNTKRYPKITFLLRQVGSLSGSTELLRVTSSGVLTIAGVSRTISLNSVGRILPNGEIIFSGSQEVKMSDHKVSPPTAMFGALKTGDLVIIKYSILLSPSGTLTIKEN